LDNIGGDSITAGNIVSESEKPRRPRGRPKGSKNKVPNEIKELAQNYAPEALDTLAEIMRDRDQPGAARVSAANSLLDRGYGKPVQANEISGVNGMPIKYEFVVMRAGSEVNAS
jgi:hypothetical protein